MQRDQPQNATEHHFLSIDLDDLPCARCPEGYDAGSVKERELLSDPKERRRFFNGEGCPACYGQESQFSEEEWQHRYDVLLENWYIACQ